MAKVLSEYLCERKFFSHNSFVTNHLVTAFVLLMILNLISLTLTKSIINEFPSLGSLKENPFSKYYQSSGDGPNNEIVYLRLNVPSTNKRTKFKRNSNYSADNEKIITITSPATNTTYYILITPNRELFHRDLALDNKEVFGSENDDAYFGSECLYNGIIISPVNGRAAISVCDNQSKMYGLMITDDNELLVIRPLDDIHKHEISKHRKSSEKLNIKNRFESDTISGSLRKRKIDISGRKGNEISDIYRENGDAKDRRRQFFTKKSYQSYESNPNSASLPHVLFRAHQLETELCDLTFISETERNNAINQYITTDHHLSGKTNGNTKDNSSVLKSDGDNYLHSNDIFKLNNNNGNNNGKINSKTRIKRSIIQTKTIETAVFIDRDLFSRFNGVTGDLTRLVLAIMNEVQLLYSFRSMKTRIKIVIVKMVILGSDDPAPNNGSGDIDKYLDNFCSWQSRKLKNENSSTRWDHALMLTGLDLYKQIDGKKNKKVLGLAWVNGMCKSSYSCTLNEGKSFEAAFVIAHEMGHSLGILHDGKGNNCDGDKYIMSEKTGPGKINWSPCSNAYLENFLSKGNAKCLDNNADNGSDDLNFGRTGRLPGEQFTPNIQCQLALGSKYQAYTSAKEPFNNICRELWCLSGSWATPAHPALEGSECGDGRKCIEGICSNVTSQTVSRRSISTRNNRKNSARTKNFGVDSQRRYRYQTNRILQHKNAQNFQSISRNRNSPKRGSNDNYRNAGDNRKRKSYGRSFIESVSGILSHTAIGVKSFLEIFHI